MAAVLSNWIHLRRSKARRALTLLVLVAFCATLVPLPMISAPQSKHSGEAFPCQNSPCGCRTAHQCWTSCCCTTPAERLAWAEQHGVTPPAYAKRVLQSLAAAAAKPAVPSKKTTCNETTSCCAKKAACCVDKAKPVGQQTAAPKASQRRFVIGALALQCQGKASAFTSLPWAIVDVRAMVQDYVLTTESQWQSDDLQPIDVSYAPPLPPPRFLCATKLSQVGCALLVPSCPCAGPRKSMRW